MNLSSFKTGLIAFLIVLLLMPLGHALMVLNEHMLDEQKLIGAFFIGVLGLALLVWGIFSDKKRTLATILGLLGGVLLWTGWIEFSFVWIAEKLNIPHLEENGEVVTNAEYLVMMSSLGLLLAFLLLFLFAQNNCTFFNWFKRVFRLNTALKITEKQQKPLALTTFIETIMLLWAFYLVLLLVYDKDIAGDKHPATYIVSYGSLLWSCYLSLKLFKLNKLDYAIRYAIPTVIVFWNFIEVLGRWNTFKEIWVYPTEHWLENLLFLIALGAIIIYYFIENKKNKQQPV
ncbi:MAG: hypothetical protein IT240_01080 [Bacteroidia bacterium]|nr:hypothetical protein [Bacteroidia bacterium]MCC6767610.1 hypothetical protein [Bacteroidia bacterium]